MFPTYGVSLTASGPVCRCGKTLIFVKPCDAGEARVYACRVCARILRVTGSRAEEIRGPKQCEGRR